ncbi:hypothetical protein SDC9_195792 [bioreactor metagenome]|uniref:Uncharacterized protein n=1 Tax=bioreactor metagenome TaxID=1076179 RepID=A0A645IA30_9ZZZZ
MFVAGFYLPVIADSSRFIGAVVRIAPAVRKVIAVLVYNAGKPKASVVHVVSVYPHASKQCVHLGVPEVGMVGGGCDPVSRGGEPLR